jgi:hypothetical protein
MSRRTPIRPAGRPRPAVACALALATVTCTLLPSVARAAEPAALPVAVVSISTDEVLDQAEALTNSMKSSLRKTPGWALQEGDWQLEVLTVSLQCAEPPDAVCETKMADQAKAERLLWGTLKKKNPTTVVADVHLWTRGKGSTSAQAEYSINLTDASDDALTAVAKSLLDKLTGGVPKGKVVIRVSDLDGEILEGGKVIGQMRGGKATVDLDAGKHTLVVRADGTTDLETIVEVKPLGSVDVTLKPQKADTGPDWQKIFGFGTIGLGLGFAAVGVVSSIRIQSLNKDLDPAREFVADDQDVCDAANSNIKDPQFDTTRVAEICNDASTFETLQMVMYPLAAVSIGTGIVLLSTADWSGDEEDTGKLVIEPRIGVGHGNVKLTYSF